MPDASRPTGYFAGEFRKAVPTLIIAVLVSFAASWWNTQLAQNDLLHRIENTEKRAESNAANIAQNSAALQQNAIRIAELVIIQTNTLEQIRDLKQEQTDIKQRLMTR